MKATTSKQEFRSLIDAIVRTVNEFEGDFISDFNYKTTPCRIIIQNDEVFMSMFNKHQEGAIKGYELISYNDNINHIDINEWWDAVKDAYKVYA